MSKTSWFFLRGLGRESGHWCHFPSRFANFFPDADITQMDLLGAGLYLNKQSPTRLEACTDFLRSQYLLKHPPHQKFLIAMSLGGMIALDWVARYPQDFAGVVIINSSLAELNPWYQRIRPLTLLSLLVSAACPSANLRERFILSRVSNLRPLDQTVLKTWQTLAKERPIMFQNIIRQLHAAKRFKLSTYALATPGLILSSSRDRLASYRCSERLAARTNFSYILHPTAGHDLALDDAIWTCSQIRVWIETKNILKNSIIPVD